MIGECENMTNCGSQMLGTNEQKNNFLKVLKIGQKEKYTIVKFLQEIQKIYGFLPESVLEVLSKEIKKPLSEIYSVASFYAEFSFSPKGKFPISVCMGTACYVNGAEGILNKIKMLLNISEGETTLDGKFSIDQTRCIGCCGMAPVVSIGEDVYGNVKLGDVEKILQNYTERI